MLQSNTKDGLKLANPTNLRIKNVVNIDHKLSEDLVKIGHRWPGDWWTLGQG